MGWRGLGFRALVGQQRGKLPVLLAALLVGPVEPVPQILKLFVELFPLPLVQLVERGHAFAQLLKLTLQTPVFKAQIERFESSKSGFSGTVRGPLGGEDPVQLGGVDGIGAVFVLRGGNRAVIDGPEIVVLALPVALAAVPMVYMTGVLYRSNGVFGNGSRKRLSVELPPALLSTSSLAQSTS